LPLVTGNTVEFARVDALDVITYRWSARLLPEVV